VIIVYVPHPGGGSLIAATLGALAFGQFKNYGASLNEAIKALQPAVRPVYYLGFVIQPQSLIENVDQALAQCADRRPGGSLTSWPI